MEIDKIKEKLDSLESRIEALENLKDDLPISNGKKFIFEKIVDTVLLESESVNGERKPENRYFLTTNGRILKGPDNPELSITCYKHCNETLEELAIGIGDYELKFSESDSHTDALRKFYQRYDIKPLEGFVSGNDVLYNNVFFSCQESKINPFDK